MALSYEETLASLGAFPTTGLGAYGQNVTDTTTAPVTTGQPSVYTPQFAPGYVNPVAAPVATGTDASKAGAIKPGGLGSEFGWNFDTLNLAFQGIESLGNIWNAWEAQKNAKESLKLQQQAYAQNMANSMKAYDTKLSDRQYARQSYTGASDADTAAYIEANKLRTV